MHEPLTRAEFIARYVVPFKGLEHVYQDGAGFIAWRRGTGDNVELLHIRTFESGKGHGRRLFYQMLDRLADRPPYYSIFGFTRVSNAEAQAFYGTLGFYLQAVEGLYAEGTAVMFWQSYIRLTEKRDRHESKRRKK